MTLLKKLSYTVLALSMGVAGVYGFRNWDAKRREEIKELKTQQDTLVQRINDFEDMLSQNKEYFSQTVDSVYQNQNLLRKNLEELAGALREDNLSQDKKIKLLNMYAAAVGAVINKESERMKTLTKNDENLASLVDSISLKIEDFKTNVLEVSVKMQDLQDNGDTERYQKIIAPTVRISCHLEVGSGTIVYSRQENGEFKTYIFTALHVVQGAKEGRPIQVSVFNDNNNNVADFAGELIDSLDKWDLAVVELKSGAAFTSAQLANIEEIRNVQRFDDIYAVGCPLGYSPIQTEGEITSQDKILEGKKYWMISAETIFGNSGCGIFLKENNELIGILTKVSAYNNFINIAVPHMGIVVSGEEIYKWLNDSNLQFLYNSDISREECFRRRERQNRRVRAPQHEENDPTVIRPVLK